MSVQILEKKNKKFKNLVLSEIKITKVLMHFNFLFNLYISFFILYKDIEGFAE